MHEPMEVCQARGRANVEDNFRIGRNTMERRYDPPSIYSRNKYSQLENLIRPEKIVNKGRSAGNAVVKHYTELQAIAVGKLGTSGRKWPTDWTKELSPVL